MSSYTGNVFSQSICIGKTLSVLLRFIFETQMVTHWCLHLTMTHAAEEEENYFIVN